MLCTDGPTGLDEHGLGRLARHHIGVDDRRIAELCGTGGQLTGLRFLDGGELTRTALFFITGQHERSGLAADLGCAFNAEGTVETGANESTNVPGLFVAGDASR